MSSENERKLFQTQLLQKIFTTISSIEDNNLEAFVLAIFRKVS